jgi:Fe-S cluster assembly protein SufD
MTAVSEQTGAWLESFTKQAAAEPWLQQLRDEAFQKFAEFGFPTTHDEEWRFTNVAPIARTNFRNLASTPGALPEAARKHLAQYASTHHPFVALNTAFLGNVTVHIVPAGRVLEAPIEIVYEVADQSGPVAVHPRTLILVGPDAHCTIVETYKGTGK